MLKDPQTEKPSVTITFAYIFFIATLISIFFLHKNPEQLTATIVTVLCWAAATIFYMVRKINKAKIDLNDQSIELESSQSSEQSDDTSQRDV